MAYMPLNKDEFYLDTSKMTRIYDLSQPWGWDTPLWPFPGPRADLTFPAGSIWNASTSAPAPTPAPCTPLPIWMPLTTPSTRRRWIGPAMAITWQSCPWLTV